MDILQNDTRSIELTQEFVEKSDRDVETIEALDKLATETGNVVFLSGGYATEVHCGGQITRPHGDIDVHFILTGDVSNEELFSKIDSLLRREETLWILRGQSPGKVEYLEDAKDKGFFNKRRIDV